MTMKGSLPPSSRTDFLDEPSCLGGDGAPGGSLPVTVTAVTRGSASTRLHLAGFDEQSLEDAAGKAGAAYQGFDGERALRHVGGVLEQADVARHQRGRERSGRPARRESSRA